MSLRIVALNVRQKKKKEIYKTFPTVSITHFRRNSSSSSSKCSVLSVASLQRSFQSLMTSGTLFFLFSRMIGRMKSIHLQPVAIQVEKYQLSPFLSFILFFRQRFGRSFFTNSSYFYIYLFYFLNLYSPCFSFSTLLHSILYNNKWRTYRSGDTIR